LVKPNAAIGAKRNWCSALPEVREMTASRLSSQGSTTLVSA
jgi:hypothetical protein